MPESLLVFIGGGLGSVFRFFTGKFFSMLIPGFPIATLISNISGSFILGFVFGFYSANAANKNAYLFFATGICGGYSTFSTFSLESLQLFQQGNYAAALLNIGLNFSLCLLFVLAGVFLSKLFH
ncbi:MAG: fluoride efflux transporter CrcB [Bacteroidota bacterium]